MQKPKLNIKLKTEFLTGIYCGAKTDTFLRLLDTQNREFKADENSWKYLSLIFKNDMSIDLIISDWD